MSLLKAFCILALLAACAIAAIALPMIVGSGGGF